MDKKVPVSSIGQILGVHRITVKSCIQSRKLMDLTEF